MCVCVCVDIDVIYTGFIYIYCVHGMMFHDGCSSSVAILAGICDGL